MLRWLRKAVKEAPKRNERIELELRPSKAFDRPIDYHIFHEARKLDPYKLCYLPDEHLLKHALVPGYFPTNYIPPLEKDLSIKETLGRRIIKKMYQDHNEPYNMHRSIVAVDNRMVNQDGDIADTLYYIAPSATVIGRVNIDIGASVWPNAVVRADVGQIYLMGKCNIQDGAVITTSDEIGPDGNPLHTIIGSRVAVGHGAKIHAAEIGEGTVIGMNATVLEGAEIGAFCVIGAGAVVPPYTKIPDGTKWVGNPLRSLGKIPYELKEEQEKAAHEYCDLAEIYQDEALESTPIPQYLQAKALADFAETLMDEEELHDSKKDELMHWDVHGKMKRNMKQPDPNFVRWQGYFDRDLNKASDKTKEPYFKREDFLPESLR